MKRSLYRRFLLTYLLIGIIGFFLVVTLGSYLTERHLEKSISETLYRQAHLIASNDTIRHSISSPSLDIIKENLDLAAEYEDTSIWILNNEGKIILTGRSSSSIEESSSLDTFDPALWGNNYYQIGDFYGYFSEQQLSVMAPITENMTIEGYVCIHYRMSDLYQRRSNIQMLCLILFACFYVLAGLLVLFYCFCIHRPFRQLIIGAEEYASGNLAYKIPINTETEIGYLANTLNFMTEKLNKNSEYQRKFISDISHDFRSPLTSIKGYINAILDGTIPPEMTEKYLRIIAHETERLEKLTSGLLTLNDLDIHKRMIQFQKFDINETIKTTAATFEGICTKHKIRLELILSGRELYARADMEQIQQVLYNLLDNAIKFSFDSSSITIETTEKNDKIFVSVKDYGIGIPKESISKIWNRFYKSDSSRGKDRKGTGLGLSIVQEIIHAHGQNINVISTEGVGTEFIFTLDKAKS